MAFQRLGQYAFVAQGWREMGKKEDHTREKPQKKFNSAGGLSQLEKHQ